MSDDMTDEQVDALIEASSLGTGQPKAIRDSVDDESVQRILDRVNDVCDAKAGDEAALARVQARTGQPVIGKAIEEVRR